MDNILPTEQFTEVEGRVYENPQTGIDESNRFIDRLRAIQSENTQKISQDTQNLGTSVPSQLGGLTGADSYFTSRYQTPQTNATVASLRATAQAAALNDVLENEQAMWKKRYNDAYRNYQKRQNNKSNTSTTTNTGGNDGGVSSNTTTVEIGEVQTEGLANSRYQKLLMKYIQAGYPIAEAEAHAKEDFGKSVSPDAPVEPYGGGN